MADQLPLGQIQPQSRPVDTLYTIGQSQVAAPAKPMEMPQFSGLKTISTASGGNVASDPMRGVIQALEPLNRQLTQFLGAGVELYAKNEYQVGLNEGLKAARLAQSQAETSAEQYAADNRKIARMDPIAGLHMDSLNPYRRGGLQTGLAQVAAGDMMPSFLGAYQRDRMRLSTLEPGSGELTRFQSGVQSETLKRYGLDISMPAVQKYVVAQANRAWDKVVELQWDDNQKYLKEQTPVLIIGETTSLLRNAQVEGVVHGFDRTTGQAVSFSRSTNPAEFRALLSDQVTSVFDKYARRMGIAGEIVPTLKKAWDDLWAVSLGEEAQAGAQGKLVDNSLMREVLSGVEIGAPMEAKDGQRARPTAGVVWGRSAVDDLLSYDAKRYEAVQRQRKTGVDDYETDLATATLGVDPGPDLLKAIDEVNKRHPGVTAADKAEAQTRMIPKMREIESYGMDPAAPQQLLNELDQQPLRDFDPKAANERLRSMLSGVPDKDKQEFLARGQTIIRRRTEERGKFDPLVGQAVDAAVVKEIAERYPSSVLEMGRGGKPIDIFGLRAHSNDNIRQASFNLENGLMKHVQNRLLDAAAKTPAMTASQKQSVIQAAIEEYTSGKYVEKLFPGVGGNKNADGTSASTPAGRAGAGGTSSRAVYQGPVYSSAQLKNLPEGDLKAYGARPLLTGATVRSELERAANGGGFSADLKAAARRAGTTPFRILEQQLKYYPALQLPKEMLDDIRRQERASAGRTAASNQVAYSPLTGERQNNNWLMNLLMPPAAAATLPPGYSSGGFRSVFGSPVRPASNGGGGSPVYSGGGGGPSGGWSSPDPRGRALIAMAQRNGWNPADLAAIFSFETGGTLNPSEPGRGAAAGRVGLIQAGPNERASYGLGSGNWSQEMTAVERYLKARGAKPGMGLADLYATVNGGNAGAGYTPDGNGVVARSSSTLRQLEQHRRQALNRLGMTNTAGGGSLAAYRPQVSSITFDSGQPGIDVYFENKRLPAVLPGRVKDIGFQGGPGSGYGHYLVIESTDPASGQRVDVLYAHLPNRPSLPIGATVRAGEVIGVQGGSGRVRSADGTIASIDFLAPRPRGSRDMTPYAGYDRLRRRIAQQLGG